MFRLRVDLWPLDFIIEVNLRTYGLVPMDDKVGPASVAAIPTRVVSLALTTSVAAIPGSVEVPAPTAHIEVALAP